MTSLQEALVESADYFASQTLGGDAKRTQSTRRKRAWAASVDATNGEKRRVCVYISRPSLVKMAKLFLNEETPNDEILRDLIGEIANSIAGKAKALASDRGLKFDISAPRFEGKAKAIGKSAAFILHYAFAGDFFSVGVVEAEL